MSVLAVSFRIDTPVFHRARVGKQYLSTKPKKEKETMEEPDVVEKNYLEQIAALKEQMEKMVAGEEYDKLVAEHKKLTDDYINKRDPIPAVPDDLKPASHYAEILAKNKKTSNLDFVKTSLAYREAYMREYGRDPWANELAEGGTTVEDSAQVAEHLTALVNEFGDNPAEFNFRFEQSLVDDPLLVAKLRNKKK
jgi:hypothetical protein